MSRFSPSVDPLEQRLALTALASVTTCEYLQSRAEIQSAILLDRTGHPRQADQFLANAASRIPSGAVNLLPLWRGELEAVTRGVPGQVVRRELFHSLDRYLHRGVEADAISVSGPLARLISRPAIRATDGAIVVDNLTGVDLMVTLLQRGSGRVVSEISLSRGGSSHFVTSPSEVLPGITSYEVEARLGEGTPTVAEVIARPGDTVLFLKGLRSIEGRVYPTGF